MLHQINPAMLVVISVLIISGCASSSSDGQMIVPKQGGGYQDTSGRTITNTYARNILKNALSEGLINQSTYNNSVNK